MKRILRSVLALIVLSTVTGCAKKTHEEINTVTEELLDDAEESLEQMLTNEVLDTGK